MRRVTAIMRPTRLEPVLCALAQAGVADGVVSRVLGSGGQKGQRDLHAGSGFAEDLVARLKLECTVADERLPAVVRTLARAARTGRLGDGKIWIEAVFPPAAAVAGEAGGATPG